MEPIRISVTELVDRLSFGLYHLDLVERPTRVLLVERDGASADAVARLAGAVRALPAVVIGVGPGAQTLAAAVDVIVEPPDEAVWLVPILDGVAASPMAAAAVVMLMRDFTVARPVEAGLVAESVTYSMLQSGPEFRTWRGANAPRRDRETTSAVIVDRVDDRLLLTLDRPHVRNALNTAMQTELTEAFALAVADTSIERVILAGRGPSFCSGGDLDEFGGFRDPAGAHLIRVSRSPARLAAMLGRRLEVHLHGACAGSGIEIPAFAGHIRAAADTAISLPELRLGLIPGAGGTVSVARRIGRHRTTQLVLSGRTIDAPTALAWGLIDEISSDD